MVTLCNKHQLIACLQEISQMVAFLFCCFQDVCKTGFGATFSHVCLLVCRMWPTRWPWPWTRPGTRTRACWQGASPTRSPPPPPGTASSSLTSCSANRERWAPVFRAPTPSRKAANLETDLKILELQHLFAIDSLSTKRYLQRKLKPNVTSKSEPMTDRGVANSPLLIGFHN